MIKRSFLTSDPGKKSTIYIIVSIFTGADLR